MRRSGALLFVLAAAAACAPKGRIEPPMETWVVEGKRASVVWQHPIDGTRAREAIYVDPDIGGQLVAYVKGEKPPEGAWIRFVGRPLVSEAPSKRPGDERTVTVRQLDVERWERMPGADAVEARVATLGDPAVPIEEKRAAIDAIYAAGRDAFPVLVAHLDDARVYERRDVQNRMGLPAHLPPPAPIVADVTVGSAVRDLLSRLIAPVGYVSPHQRAFKAHSATPFLVKDWRAFWERRRGKSLDEIRDEMKPHLDRWYQTGGDAQPVE